jgi:Flp pilus assembly protein TadG
MRIRTFTPAQRRQRGQTMALVALSLLTLVAMAALAIDLTTLYGARGEMQRAANAAALAGAKAFVESGTTTDPANTTLQALATTIGDAYIGQLLSQNEVGNVAPTLVGTPTRDYTTHPGNPQITVKVQRTDVPTFFARIFGRRLATVSATATAEAYNSSQPPGPLLTNMPPVAPSCTKPWLVANIDPNHANGPFVNADGSLANPGVWTGGAGGIIGEPITLNALTGVLPPTLSSPGYLLADITAPSGSCPACAGGAGNFAQSVACCDTANSTLYRCGSTTTPILNLNVPAAVTDALSGAACLLTGIAGGPGPGRDTIDLSGFQSSSGPILITSHTPPQSGRVVNTSQQIVTLPIIDVGLLGLNAKVIGYMQAFVVSTSATGMTMDVLNISGCGTNVDPARPAVTGGSSSPVPVRLVRN